MLTGKTSLENCEDHYICGYDIFFTSVTIV